MKALAIVAALFLAAPAMASDTPPAAGTASAEVPDRLICKTSNSTGSRLRKTKSCRTASEWAELREQTRDKAAEVQRMGLKAGACDASCASQMMKGH